MTEPFSKYLGKILLMTIAALLVACGDSGSSTIPGTSKIIYAFKPFAGSADQPPQGFYDDYRSRMDV